MLFFVLETNAAVYPAGNPRLVGFSFFEMPAVNDRIFNFIASNPSVYESKGSWGVPFFNTPPAGHVINIWAPSSASSPYANKNPGFGYGYRLIKTIPI